MQLGLGAPDRRTMTRGTTPDEPSRPDLKALIARCYSETPGLWLTSAQVARLLNVRPTACQAVLDELVREGRLRRDGYGQYMPPGALWFDGTRV
jgi:hypothetical protein